MNTLRDDIERELQIDDMANTARSREYMERCKFDITGKHGPENSILNYRLAMRNNVSIVS